MNTEHTTPELLAALADAQGEIENASKNSTNPHFKSKYADLAEVLSTIRETFPKHGLSLIQSPSFDGSLAHVTTLVGHKSGGFLFSVASCVPAKSDAQGIGAATTYLRRYGSSAMAGIAQEDDDGQAARHDQKPVAVQLPAGRPMDGVWEAMNEEEQAWLLKIAGEVNAIFDSGDIKAAHDHIVSQNLGTDEKAALWSQLGSKVRTALKKADAAAKSPMEKAA
jgi:hypothetical protein